jgi:hypothetical protein
MMRKLRHIASIGIFIFFAHLKGFSQLGSWNILNAKLPMDSVWQITAEGQLRSLSYYNDFHYYEYKTALTYAISKTRSITAGVGSYRTFLAGGNFRTPAAVKEIRSWLEFSMRDPGRILLLEHRYRIEQRYTNNGYKNRFRYRFGAILPFSRKSPYFLAGWEEIFFTNRAPYFERIRSSLVLGRKFQSMTIHAGYLHQFDYKISDETGTSFFQVSLSFTLNKEKFKSISVPFQEG